MCVSEGRKTTMSQDNDTIYRQAAIDAMCGACSDWCDEGVCYKVSAIQKLPSVQPEAKPPSDEHGAARSWDEVGKLIRCKDCKYYKSYTLSAVTQGFCNRLGLMAMEVDDFCSRAEWAER